MEIDQIPPVEYVEQAIQQLYGNGNHREAQEYLHNLQKQPYAWDLAPQLLRSEACN
ncbi:10565_t:CDS:2 [Paraglomus occultum]|uniref:10565_t:CDS:1 n=1 Tax=Paraglomus occultum TaxID=144539 RepID=A0A9N8ZRF1_9GLOM|nr:10565_t:CDS:2 [Paraglomus occultum]